MNAITIAAHVDSDKGIFNDLNGSYRARVFKSEYLDGISVNTVTQIDKIKSLLQQPKYKRSKPLAIIQSSDHHCTDHCGRKVAYFNLADLTFPAINECFINPIENISPTERPEIKNIISRLAADKNSVIMEYIDIDKISQSVCAILNNYFGSLIIGITNDKYQNIKGINVEDNTIETIIEKIKESIEPEKIYYSISAKTVPYGGKNIIIINIKNISTKDFFHDKKYYRIENKCAVACNAKELLLDTQEKNSSFSEEFYENYDTRLKEINTELHLLMKSKSNLQLINKINADSIKLKEILKLDLVHFDPNINIEEEDNGSVGEDVFYTLPLPGYWAHTVPIRKISTIWSGFTDGKITLCRRAE